MLNDWRDKFRRFMVGRYGTDELNRFLMTAVLVLIVINIFVRTNVLFLLELLCLILCYARMFSRNTNRRFEENQKFLRYQFQAAEKWKTWKFRFQEGRKYKIFKCPNCGQKIRIPRGHGKISIHCKKCGNDFIGRS